MTTTAASTQTAIILVTDLVGSTELRARVGEDEAERLRRHHDQLLVEAVERHYGEVVKGLGDGVLARFAGAAEAVAAAVDIQQAAARRGFDIRVGASAGDVTVEGGDVFGTPVIEASRLCAAAAGGQILVAQLVQLLARGRGGHAFAVVGEMELKGLPEPVSVAEVRWEPVAGAGGASIPLPAGLAAGDRLLYAGRASQRTLLRERWKAAVAGDRQVVLISGEPGMGKTRLAAELAREVHHDDAVVLFGRADEDIDTAHRAVAEALRHLIVHAPPEVLEAHAAEHGDILTKVVPELVRRLPDVAPAPPREDDRLALFDAVADLLGRTAALSPVLLVLDDLHWADHASLLFLRHFVRSAPTMPVLVVGTYRDTDLSRSHPLAAMLADLRRERNVERLDLPGLDGDEITELMAVNAGHELNDSAIDLAQVIHGETGGNPFFVGEILTHLVESGTIYERDGRWTSDTTDVSAIGVPEGVREVIGRRLGALSDDADRAMRTAAAIGQDVDLRVLAHMLDTDVDTLIDTLDEPLQRGLLLEVPGAVDRVRFAHALVRQALYEELSASRRVRLHHRVATALAAIGRGTVAEQAHHACEAAVVAGAEGAVALAVAAAEDALSQLAWEQAAGWYRRGLDAEESIDDPDPARRARLLVSLAEARNAASEMREARADAQAAADLARRAGDGDLLVRAAIAYGGGLGAWVDPDDTAGVALVDEALAALGQDDLVARAMLLLRKSAWLMLDADPGERLALTAEAVAVARSLGDPDLLTAALGQRADAMRGLPDAREIGAVARELREIAARENIGPRILDARYWTASAMVLEGDLAGAAAFAMEWLADAEQTRHWSAKATALGLTAQLAVMAGRFDDARRRIAAIRELGPVLGDSSGIVLTGFENVLLIHAGDAEAFAAHAAAHEDAMRGIIPTEQWQAVAAALRNDLNEAAAATTACIRTHMATMPSWCVTSLLGSLAQAAWRLDPALAQESYERLLPEEGRWIGAGFESVVESGDVALARYAAVAGRPDEAIARLERGLAFHDRCGEVPLRAGAAVDLARLLLERDGPGDRERAGVLAGEALATAERLGLAATGRRAAGLV